MIRISSISEKVNVRVDQSQTILVLLYYAISRCETSAVFVVKLLRVFSSFFFFINVYALFLLCVNY